MTLLVPGEVFCQAPAALHDRADELDLHKDPYWHLLLHYESSLFGVKSTVDDPKFFLAKSGKKNPEAELHATLDAFYAQPVEDEPHALDLFVARYLWLDEQLTIDESTLPRPGVEQYRQTLAQLKPNKATLIFPSAYMNNPTSMFGHTLLVFDSANSDRLLSKAVNYGVQEGPSFGPAFAALALFGVLDGFYSVQPYYDTVEKYNDVNARDIWEYELNFTEAEIERMLRHVWEMQHFKSDYFFFTENCSYNLLYLVESGRPSIGLRKKFPLQVIPIDVIRVAVEEGLIGDVHYRPSKASTINHLANQLPPEQRQKAMDIANGTVVAGDAGAEGDEGRLLLNLSAELCQYLYLERTIDESAYKKSFFNILRTRSKLGQPDDAARFEVPRPAAVETSHRSKRWALSGGIQDGEGFVGMRLRPAYHTLTDHPRAFEAGAHIEFFDFEGRYYPENDEWELEYFELLEIQSLAARTQIFQPRSWKAVGRLERMRFDDDDDELIANANTTAGRTYAYDGGLAYGALEGGALAGPLPDDDYALGLGLSGGILMELPNDARLHTDVQALYYGLGTEAFVWSLNLEANFPIQTSRSIHLRSGVKNFDGYTSYQASLSWNVYF